MPSNVGANAALFVVQEPVCAHVVAPSSIHIVVVCATDVPLVEPVASTPAGVVMV
jgi:hypothetical protein